LKIIEEIIVYIETKPVAVEELIKPILIVFNSALIDHIIPTFSNSTAGSLSTSFSNKMFWRSIKLLSNMIAFEKYVPLASLSALAITTLINSRIIPYLKHAPRNSLTIILDGTLQILNIFPRVWFFNAEITDAMSPLRSVIENEIAMKVKETNDPQITEFYATIAKAVNVI